MNFYVFGYFLLLSMATSWAKRRARSEREWLAIQLASLINALAMMALFVAYT